MATNMKNYIAPIGLMLGTLLLGFYLLTGPAPVAQKTGESTSRLDAEIAEHYAAMAEQYAKDAAEDKKLGASTKKAGSI